MSADQLIAWGFQTVAVGAVGLALLELRRMRESVEKLNVNVAVVIEKTDNHERRITRLEGE